MSRKTETAKEKAKYLRNEEPIPEHKPIAFIYSPPEGMFASEPSKLTKRCGPDSGEGCAVLRKLPRLARFLTQFPLTKVFGVLTPDGLKLTGIEMGGNVLKREEAQSMLPDLPWTV